MADTDRILRLPEVQQLVPLCEGSIIKGVRAKTFPQPVRLGVRAIGWRLSDLQAWMAGLDRVDAAAQREEAA